METNNSVGGNDNNSNNNDNNNNSNNTNDDEFVLESTFDIAGDELDVLNSEDNDEEQVDNKIDEEEEMERDKKKLHSKMMDYIENWLNKKQIKVRKQNIKDVRRRMDKNL